MRVSRDGVRLVHGKRNRAGHDDYPERTQAAQLDGVLGALEVLVNSPEMIAMRQRQETRVWCRMLNRRWRAQLERGVLSAPAEIVVPE